MNEPDPFGLSRRFAALPSMVLLGAGASVDAGVPATVEMTRDLVDNLESNVFTPEVRSALHFVCGALIAYDAARGESPYAGLDIERVFAAVELLANRHSHEASPFVSAWHPAVDTWDQQRRAGPSRASRRRIEEAIQDISNPRGHLRGRRPGPGIDALIRQGAPSPPPPADGTTYYRLSKAMINELAKLVAIDRPGATDYLQALVRPNTGKAGISIATLNYDRSIEIACAQAVVPVSTQFERWSAKRGWEWPSSGVRLLKLHGSIDWRWRPGEREPGRLSEPKYFESLEHPNLSSAYENQGQPLLVFGRREKLRAHGPFLSLLAEFETQLEQADHLLIVGYSFRDDHVNEAIRRWASLQLNREITVVDPRAGGFAETTWRPPFLLELVSALGSNESGFLEKVEVPRLHLVEAGAAEALSSLRRRR